MKKIILAGNMPYVAVAILCIAAFYSGQATVKQTGKFAIAEKGALVLQAVLDRPSDSPETISREVAQPIIGVLKQYADRGYAVLDTV